MEYAQLNEAGTEAIQITTHGNVAWDENNFCSAAALIRDGKADQFRVVPLTIVNEPVFDPITQVSIRDGCELVNGQWQYKWRIDELSAEQIAANQVTKTAALLATYVNALTNHLDVVAQSHNYDNRITCSVRAAYPGPYQAEGIAFGSWMDQCNQIGYQMLADYQTGLISQPTVEELITSLPEMIWPA